MGNQAVFERASAARNKRRQDRLPAADGMSVKIEGNALVRGRLADISMEGLMVLLGQPLAPGGLVRLVIEDAAHTAHTTVKALCRWCDPLPDRGHYRVGFQFDPPGQIPSQRISHLILNLAEP